MHITKNLLREKTGMWLQAPAKATKPDPWTHSDAQAECMWAPTKQQSLIFFFITIIIIIIIIGISQDAAIRTEPEQAVHALTSEPPGRPAWFSGGNKT